MAAALDHLKWTPPTNADVLGEITYTSIHGFSSEILLPRPTHTITITRDGDFTEYTYDNVFLEITNANAPRQVICFAILLTPTTNLMSFIADVSEAVGNRFRSIIVPIFEQHNLQAKGRGVRNAMLVSEKMKIPHGPESIIASMLSGVEGKNAAQQGDILKANAGIQGPAPNRKGFSGGRRTRRRTSKMKYT
jgi:hypothetical protein